MVYQDIPCKPGAYRDNVLSARTAKGAVTYVSLKEPQKFPLGAGNVLEPPALSEQELQALEERQQLLGKPSIKQQLAAPTPIEARSHVVWISVSFNYFAVRSKPNMASVRTRSGRRNTALVGIRISKSGKRPGKPATVPMYPRQSLELWNRPQNHGRAALSYQP